MEEVKLAIKPYYQKKDITKEEYKDILRKAVHKVGPSGGQIRRSGERTRRRHVHAWGAGDGGSVWKVRRGQDLLKPTWACPADIRGTRRGVGPESGGAAPIPVRSCAQQSAVQVEGTLGGWR